MEIFCAFVFGFAILVLLVLFAIKNQEFVPKPAFDLPKISILIAVRNEQQNLTFLFESLNQLEYPRDLLQILIGDDQSEDESLQMIQDFCAQNTHASYSQIMPSSKQVAKANVLMQLAHQATGEWLYVMDADMRPDPDILYHYVRSVESGFGGITGVSVPQGNSLWQKMQKIDWVFALSMAYKAQSLNYETTAMGNNMLVKKSVYEQIGGYGKLEKTLVEDYTLYKAIRAKGYDFPVIFDRKLLSFTEPIAKLSKLLHQRKRWMTGGMKVHWFLKTVLAIQGIYYPMLLVALCMSYTSLLVLVLLKTTLQSIFIYQYFKKLNLKINSLDFLLYEIYQSVFTSMLLIFYLLPLKLDWKNRTYGNN